MLRAVRRMLLLGGAGCAAAAAFGAAALAEDAPSSRPATAGPRAVPALRSGEVASATPASTTRPEAQDAVPPDPLRKRASGAGGTELLDALRRRSLEEEQRKQDVVRERNDRLFEQLTLDLRSPNPLRLRGLHAETSGETFLRAVALPDWENAPVERHGVDKYAMRQVQRFYRRLYRHDLETREQLDPRHAPDRYCDNLEKLELALDEHNLQWQRPFPSYWDGNPAAHHEPERLVLGEKLDIVRLGKLSLDNELHLKYDVHSLFLDRPYSSENDDPAIARKALPVHSERVDAPVGRGSLFSGDTFIVSGRLGFHPALTPTSGFCQQVSSTVDWTVFDPYNRRELLSICLDLTFDPQDSSSEVSLLFSLARF